MRESLRDASPSSALDTRCCPLKHEAWKKSKLEKTELLKKVEEEEEEEELLKTQAKKVKTQAKTLVPA